MSDQDWDKWEGDFDEQQLFANNLAKALAPLYKAFLGQGLSAAEAAALTAAVASQGLPTPPVVPPSGEE